MDKLYALDAFAERVYTALDRIKFGAVSCRIRLFYPRVIFYEVYDCRVLPPRVLGACPCYGDYESEAKNIRAGVICAQPAYPDRIVGERA